jgi:hypothetical protein
MLDKMMAAGIHDACKAFGVAIEKVANPVAPPANPSIWQHAKNFGAGQVDAAKGLFQNTRGWAGGAHNPNIITGAVPEASAHLARGAQGTAAMGNLKTLAPSLALAGGAYMLHRHGVKQDEEHQRQMMMNQGAY